jgi:hypothetical protein
MSKLPMMMFIAAILIASVVVLTVPAANALIKRDYYYLNDQHLTARFGNTQVCGDHMCAPGEWDKLQASLAAAQLGHQGGRNQTQPSSAPAAGTAPAPPTTAPTATCESVKTILNSAGISSTVVAKVMADLGCSSR